MRVCREKSDHRLLELGASPTLPVLNQMARQFVNFDPVYLRFWLGREWDLATVVPWLLLYLSLVPLSGC